MNAKGTHGIQAAVDLDGFFDIDLLTRHEPARLASTGQKQGDVAQLFR